MTGKIIPLIAPPLRYCDLNDTPLMGLQMLRRDSKEDMMNLYEELRRLKIALNESFAEFSRALDRYMSSRNKVNMIEKDENGCYVAKNNQGAQYSGGIPLLQAKRTAAPK